MRIPGNNYYIDNPRADYEEYSGGFLNGGYKILAATFRGEPLLEELPKKRNWPKKPDSKAKKGLKSFFRVSGKPKEQPAPGRVLPKHVPGGPVYAPPRQEREAKHDRFGVDVPGAWEDLPGEVNGITPAIPRKPVPARPVVGPNGHERDQSEDVPGAWVDWEGEVNGITPAEPSPPVRLPKCHIGPNGHMREGAEDVPGTWVDWDGEVNGAPPPETPTRAQPVAQPKQARGERKVRFHMREMAMR